MNTRPTILESASVALVLETRNLGGGPTDRFAIDSLRRVLDALREQTHGLSTLHEVVITHQRRLDAHHESIESILGRSVRLVALDGDVDYYGAKNVGFDATSADVVVFADSDYVPEPQWLAALLAPLLDPTSEPHACVVAGRTSYRDNALGRGLSAIDFMYFPSDHGSQYRRDFYANNVAFRRGVFASRR